MTSAGDRSSRATSQPLDRAEIERRARVKLPEGIRDLQVETITGGMDDAIYLRFDLPTGELGQLLSDAGFTEPLSSTERFLGNYTGSHLSWWQPDAIVPFQSGNLIRDDRKPRHAISVLASRGDSAWQTVYLFVNDL